MPLRGWNWLTRVAAIVPAKHLLEIQTANRNAEKGIGDGMCSPVCGRNARGKEEQARGRSNIEIVWKDGHNKETRVVFVWYAILELLYRGCYSFFFLFSFLFYGSKFFWFTRLATIFCAMMLTREEIKIFKNNYFFKFVVKKFFVKKFLLF